MPQQQLYDDNGNPITLYDDNGNPVSSTPAPTTTAPVAEATAPPQESAFKRGWNAINEPLVRFPQGKEAVSAFSEKHPWLGPVMGFGLEAVESASSPLGVVTGGLGGAELGAGKLGYNAATNFLRRADRVSGALSMGAGAEDLTQGNLGAGAMQLGMGYLGARSRRGLPPAATPAVANAAVPPVAPNILGQAAPNVPNVPPPIAAPPPVVKRSFRGEKGKFGPRVDALANADGTFTEINTGAIYDNGGTLIKAGRPQRLPNDLSGAKPQFKIGANAYTPRFASDIDKALYIIAQKNKSARDADYLNFVMHATGLPETEARVLGIKVKQEIHKAATGSPGGEIPIARIWKPEIPGANGIPPAAAAGGGGSGIPPNAPPPAPPGPPNNNPIQAMPAAITPKATHLSAIITDKKGNKFTEIMMFPRAMQSAWDLSFPFRQGLGSIHKKEWWGAWGNMIRAYGDENAFRLNQAAIEARPLFKPEVDAAGNIIKKGFAQSVGLHLTELTEDLSKREEQIMSTWAEKVPGVRASNRAYTTFGNQLRADMFEELVNTAKKNGMDPETDLELAKKIASFVNTASGRGDLGKLEDAAVVLNAAFFSPRLIASRLSTIKNGLDPRRYHQALIGNDPAARMVAREQIKSLSAMLVAWTAIAGAAKLGGAEVSFDPNNSDFGKIRIGDTRLDPAGGLQQYLVMMMRMASGEPTASSTGKSHEFGAHYGSPTRGDAAVDFVMNKTSPWVKYGWDLMNASSERPVSVFDRTARMVAPFIAQDLIDLGQEDPSLLPLTIPLGAVGFGSQTYGDKGTKESMFGERNDVQWKGGKFFD